MLAFLFEALVDLNDNIFDRFLNPGHLIIHSLFDPIKKRPFNLLPQHLHFPPKFFFDLPLIDEVHILTLLITITGLLSTLPLILKMLLIRLAFDIGIINNLSQFQWYVLRLLFPPTNLCFSVEFISKDTSLELTTCMISSVNGFLIVALIHSSS